MSSDPDATYRHVIDALDDALFVHDPVSGAIIDVNARACALFGRDREALLRARVSDLTDPPITDDVVLRSLERAMGEGAFTLDARGKRADGTLFLAEVKLKRVRLGGADGALAFVRDVTLARAAEEALRRSEEALRESRAFLEAAQEVGRIGSWVSSLGEDKTLVWSREAYRIFQVEEGTPIDNDVFFARVHPDDRTPIREAVQRAIAERRPYEIDHRITLPDGRVRWLHERADVQFDAAGAPARLIGVAQDITDRRETEEQLRQVAKMEAVGRLAGGVAHDFNNALTAIAGYADLAALQLGDRAAAPTDEPLRASLTEIKQATLRAAALTRQLLTFSRRGIVQPRVVDVGELVRALEPMLQRVLGEEVQLVTSLEEDLGRVRAGHDQLEQALVNLVVNARDAMPRGGKLTIETRNVVIDAGRHVLLQVSDTGHGMDEQVRARIFEPFFTTKERGKGTGLGLSTAFAAVQQAGGHITVRSAPGEGATFRIYLPRVDAPADPRVDAAELPRPGGRETVLLAEDDRHVRDLTSRILSLHGYSVLTAVDAEEALARADAFAGRIHLLLTDVVMPGDGGRELFERLRARRAGLAVLFMSGYTDDAVVQRGVSRGTCRFLQKPFTPDALLREVRAALEARPEAPPPLPA
jgi:two-component system, cell cycle sensor histidine kinase and response regulator CckA